LIYGVKIKNIESFATGMCNIRSLHIFLLFSFKDKSCKSCWAEPRGMDCGPYIDERTHREIK